MCFRMVQISFWIRCTCKYRCVNIIGSGSRIMTNLSTNLNYNMSLWHIIYSMIPFQVRNVHTVFCEYFMPWFWHLHWMLPLFSHLFLFNGIAQNALPAGTNSKNGPIILKEIEEHSIHNTGRKLFRKKSTWTNLLLLLLLFTTHAHYFRAIADERVYECVIIVVTRIVPWSKNDASKWYRALILEEKWCIRDLDNASIKTNSIHNDASNSGQLGPFNVNILILYIWGCLLNSECENKKKYQLPAVCQGSLQSPFVSEEPI